MGIRLTNPPQGGGDRHFQYKRINQDQKYVKDAGGNDTEELNYDQSLHVIYYTDEAGDPVAPVAFQETYTCPRGEYAREPAIILPGVTYKRGPTLDSTEVLYRMSGQFGTKCLNTTLEKGHSDHTPECNPTAFYRLSDMHGSLELRETENMGIGVFATDEIAANTILGLYSGECRPENSQLDIMHSRYSHEINLTDPSRRVIIDSLERGNWPRFVNHHCNEKGRNCKFQIHRNIGTNAAMIMTTTKKIAVDQQLFTDYGREYFREQRRKATGELWKKQLIRGEGCKCGWYNCHSVKDKKKKAQAKAATKTTTTAKPKAIAKAKVTKTQSKRTPGPHTMKMRSRR